MKNLFSLTMPMVDNYDKNLFEEIDGSLQSTTYFKYLAANFAKDFFKRKIDSLDNEHLFMRQNVVEDVDPKVFETAKSEYYEKYSEFITLADNEKKKWRDDHKHFYRMQPSLPSSAQYADLFNFDFEMSLEEAVQGYKSAHETLKLIENSDLDKWCTELKPMLNYEHRDEYNKAMDEINKKFNILSDIEIKKKLPITKVTKKRLSLNRQKCENFDLANKFIHNFYLNYASFMSSINSNGGSK